MAYNKIGFLASGSGGNPTGIGNYVRECDAAGIPAVVLCNDGDVGISDALNLIEAGSKVPHVMAFRVAKNDFYGTPDYWRSPAAAAVEHWRRIKAEFHPRIVEQRDKVWILPNNEVDKNRADWLGFYAYEIARLANSEGFKVMPFSFAAGEPEYHDWLTSGMVKYLKYCNDNPEKAGVCIHEYSYDLNSIRTGFPYMVGRHQLLHDACDELGLRRPKIIIGEWGWVYDKVPDVPLAMEHIHDIAAVYAKQPNILGAGLWYLGPYLGIAEKAQKLIAPVTDLTVTVEYEGETMARGAPRTQYNREYWVIHGSVSAEKAKAIFNLAIAERRTVGWSFDDAGIGDLDVRHVVAWGVPQAEHTTYRNWYVEHYPGVTVEFREAPATGSGFRSHALAD